MNPVLLTLAFGIAGMLAVYYSARREQANLYNRMQESRQKAIDDAVAKAVAEVEKRMGDRAVDGAIAGYRLGQQMGESIGARKAMENVGALRDVRMLTGEGRN